MANAWALDVRVPLFDRALAEASFRLPPQMKLHGACEKYVLKLALQKHLPREIVWRRKFGMSVPITDWVLGPLAAGAGGPARPARRWHGAGCSARSTSTGCGTGRTSRTRSRRRRIGERLWTLAMLEAWLRVFIDGRGRRPGGVAMKCIRCGHDSKYKDRTGRKCPSCSGQFAFEPKDGDPFTDMRVQVRHRGRLGERPGPLGRRAPVLRGVPPSSEAHARRGGARRPAVFAVASASCVAILAWLLQSRSLVVGWSSWSCVLADLRRLRPRRHRSSCSIEPEVRPPVEPLGAASTAARRASSSASRSRCAARPLEPDIGDYSFDRAVICDRARTVDLLLANNFHFENNCAVLSVGGYPQGPFEIVRAHAQAQPEAAGLRPARRHVAGCQLAHQLANDRALVRRQVKVTDVGLRPRHAGPFRGLLLAACADAVRSSPEPGWRAERGCAG